MTMAGLAACEPTTRGVHHLALCTDDMKATVEFYTDIVGMPLVHAMKVPEGLGTGPNNRGNPPYESVRHYFFDMGNDSLLAFFEIPRDAEPPCNRNAIGAMQHCSFVVTAKWYELLEQRLKEKGVPYVGPLPQLPGLTGIYFLDPNGTRLEFACQPDDGEDPKIVSWATQSRAEIESELLSLPGVDDAWIERYAVATR